MRRKLSNRTKTLIVFIFLLCSVAGFMVKLPSAFRHIDKELHTAFYFLAAAFLNILFSNGKLVSHIMIFVILFLFGISIEYAQDYSNHFFHTRIHGRYDPEDVKYNVKGLIAFSIIWIPYWLIKNIFNKPELKKATDNLD